MSFSVQTDFKVPHVSLKSVSVPSGNNERSRVGRDKLRKSGRILENGTVGEKETHKGESYAAVWTSSAKGK